VVDDDITRKAIIASVYQQGGHKGREVTYNLVSKRYFWLGLWSQVKDAVACCPICQKYTPWRPVETAIPTTPQYPMMKVHIDAQYLLLDRRMKYLFEGRCDLTGWVEAKPSASLTAPPMRVF
ncbi:hypothetical protein BKA56DRAFT_424949, partial [Ilyonectria sp. MPI-CAGE-AT-0026]